LAIATAGLFNKAIHALNLASLTTDASLFNACRELPQDVVLLLEDVDVALATATRTPQRLPKAQASQLSLSALLNVLDGVFAASDRILIMTSNYPERLDPAIIRPGRIDYRIDFPATTAAGLNPALAQELLLQKALAQPNGR
jgi:chaperone BCS1